MEKKERKDVDDIAKKGNKTSVKGKKFEK